MDEKTKADYERAAVALERHADLPTPYEDVAMEPWAQVAWKAWAVIARQFRGGPSRTPETMDVSAARLLRDCIARNEVMT